jgi:hypothetical protein
MTAQGVFDRLTSVGVRFSADGGRLRIDAPVGLLTEDDRLALRTHKAALISLLMLSDTSLLADVLALAEARGWPRLQAGSHTIVGRDAWLATIGRPSDVNLLVVRAALREAQRRDGPHPTTTIHMT